jgi:hypothetical protein
MRNSYRKPDLHRVIYELVEKNIWDNCHVSFLHWVCVCVCVRARACVCVCVCVHDKDRKTTNSLSVTLSICVQEVLGRDTSHPDYCNQKKKTMFSIGSVPVLYEGQTHEVAPRQNRTYWNCSACKIRFSAPLALFQGAHRSAICMWLSKFRTFMII